MGILFKTVDDWINKHRAWSLLAAVFITVTMVALINWLTGSDHFRQFFYPKRCVPTSPESCDPIEWKELFQAAVLILGLPIAFLLWHWRDRNVRDQIENTRKDLNYREFNEIQVRLAGAIDIDVSEKSSIALQTSALFQMSEFLSGDRGDQFARTAFEAVRAKYNSDFEELFSNKFKREIHDFNQIYDKIIQHRFKKYHHLLMLMMHLNHDLRKIGDLYQKDPSKRMNRRFFSENFQDIFLNNKYAHYFNISTLHIPSVVEDKNLAGIQAIGTRFSGEKIHKVKFTNSNLLGAAFLKATITKCDFRLATIDLAKIINSSLENCDFSHAKLRKIQLQDVDPITYQLRSSKLVKCSFQGADLTWTSLGEQDFTDTDFSSAILICTDFGRCNVAGSNFTNCDIRGANMTRIDPRLLKSCQDARFDDSTKFHLPTPGTSLSWTHEQLQEIRDLWRSCGAKHVNDS